MPIDNLMQRHDGEYVYLHMEYIGIVYLGFCDDIVQYSLSLTLYEVTTMWSVSNGDKGHVEPFLHAHFRSR